MLCKNTKRYANKNFRKEKNMSKFMKGNNKGITLISLIITIIIMTILASITVATISGDDDLITKSEEAKNAMIQSDKNENDILKNILGYANNIGGGSGGTGGNSGGDSEEDPVVCAHIWDAGVINPQATCTTTGTKTYTCSLCGNTKIETLPAKGHSYSGAVTTPATETTNGIMTYTCANCGDTYTQIIPATGSAHTCSYTQTVATDAYRANTATCLSPATYYYSCTCGNKGTETFPYGDSAEHNYNYKSTDAKYLKDELTCGQNETFWYRCQWCDSMSTEDYWINAYATNNHSWNSGESISDTETKYTCTVCGKTKTVIESDSGEDECDHTYDVPSGIVASAGNCKNKTEYYYVCSGCGETDPNYTYYGDYGDHNFVDDDRVSMCQICTICGSATEHTMQVVGSAAICEECTVCGYTLSHNLETSMLYDGGQSVEVRCGADWELVESCTNCSYSNVLSSGGPVECWADDSKTVTTDATCTTEGKVEYYCASCGKLISTETIPKTEHSTGLELRVESATCTEPETTYWECTVCGEEFSTTERKRVRT